MFFLGKNVFDLGAFIRVEKIISDFFGPRSIYSGFSLAKTPLGHECVFRFRKVFCYLLLGKKRFFNETCFSASVFVKLMH